MPSKGLWAFIAFASGFAILIHERQVAVTPQDDAAPLAVHKFTSAPGAPIVAPAAAPAAVAAPTTTNEQIQAAIELEKKRMGIRAILPPQPARVRPRVLGLSATEREVLVLPKEPAVVEGVTPSLLAGAASGGPPPTGAAVGAGASGVIVASEDERAALWVQRGLTAAAPAADYSKSRLAFVVANDFSSIVEIIDARQLPDRIILLYHLKDAPPMAGKSNLSWQSRTLPKSDIPIVFERRE